LWWGFDLCLGFAAAWATDVVVDEVVFVDEVAVAAVRGLLWVVVDADEPHPAIASAASRAAAGRRS
jgi:hypothetical protein